jgi:hypothetical protein
LHVGNPGALQAFSFDLFLTLGPLFFDLIFLKIRASVLENGRRLIKFKVETAELKVSHLMSRHNFEPAEIFVFARVSVNERGHEHRRAFG